MSSRIIILDSCVKELKKFPLDIQRDLLVIVEQLNDGIKLNMPLSRPMPSIGKGVHELRLKDKSGQFRVIYCYLTSIGNIYFVHAIQKKSQSTPKKNLELAKKRIRSLQ